MLWGLWNALILTLERHAWKPETWPVAVCPVCAGGRGGGFVPLPALPMWVRRWGPFWYRGGTMGAGAAAAMVLLALLAAVVIVALEGRGLAARLPMWVRRMLALVLLGVSLLAVYGAAHVPFLYAAY